MPDFDKPENAKGRESDAADLPITDVVLIYMTFPDGDAAAVAGETLVERGLAACVNIIPGMVSIYRWKGEINRDREVVMIVKTRREAADAAMAAARERHPYENPAMLVIPVHGGARAFLEWIAAETRTPRPS